MATTDIVIVVTEELGRAAITGKTDKGIHWVYEREGSEALSTCYVTSEELVDIRLELIQKDISFEMK